MSSKRYVRNCDFCGKVYVARSRKSRFDSDTCRGAYRRASQREKPNASERKIIPVPKFSGPVTSPKFNEQDVWILLGRICRLWLSFNYDFIGDLYRDKRSEELISDFERRFSCRIESAQNLYPGVKPGKTNIENEAIVNQYADLEYSR